MHPGEKPRLTPHRTMPNQGARRVRLGLGLRQGPPGSIARWFPNSPVSLGTDGFGRSESREALRDHFEVDYRFIAPGALSALAHEGQIENDAVAQAMKDLEIDPAKPNPIYL